MTTKSSESPISTIRVRITIETGNGPQGEAEWIQNVPTRFLYDLRAQLYTVQLEETLAAAINHYFGVQK